MRALSLLVAACLSGCGGGIEGVWVGTCEATPGTIEILTGEVSEAAGPSSEIDGEHTLYLATAALTYPDGTVFDTILDFVRCTDREGCAYEGTTAPQDGTWTIFRNPADDSIQATGSGPLQKGSIDGACITPFGQDPFHLERE